MNEHSTPLARRAQRQRGPAPVRASFPAAQLGRLPVSCRHCGGSGKEPGALQVEFSRSGEVRGDQQKMAEATGISAAMLSYIFAGERAPGVLNLIRIARYLRTTVDRVLKIPAIAQKVRELELAELDRPLDRPPE